MNTSRVEREPMLRVASYSKRFISTTFIFGVLFRTTSAMLTRESSKRARRSYVPLAIPSSSGSEGATTPLRPVSSAAVVTPTPTTHDERKFLDLEVPPEEFRPSVVLTTGQCFHWTALSTPTAKTESTSAWGIHNATEWMGILRAPDEDDAVVVILQETPSTVLYHTLHTPPGWTRDTVHSFLRSYFQLDTVSVTDLYREWSTQCPRLARIAAALPGLRMVEQDPFECLVSFLCSSNNNIPRITQMLNKIRRTYGRAIPLHDTPAYTFPSLDTLRRHATEKDLRAKCGMGYRAKYLMQTMERLHQLGGESYLRELRHGTAQQEALLQFTGVGHKVADCIALCSLRAVDAVPVDVHVWNIARRDYGMASSSTTSLTPKLYGAVAKKLQEQFPRYSGWAHALLFAAELPSFRERLPADMVDEMQEVSDDSTI